LLINSQLHHPHSHFPKNRQLVVRNIGPGLSVTDQLATRPFAKPPLQCLFETESRFAANQRAIPYLYWLLSHSKRVGLYLDELSLRIQYCSRRRVAHASRRTAGAGGAIVGGDFCIRSLDANLIQGHTKLFTGDLRKNRPHPLTHLRAAGQDIDDTV